MSDRVTVHKLDEAGNEVWSYQGRLLVRQPNRWTLEATFGRKETRVGDLIMEAGDRFVETFYADRWYNVFEVHDGGTDRLKGWYCNLARPARLAGRDVFQEDLALDLVVYPGGAMEILDREDFEALDIPDQERAQVRAGLEELTVLARAGLDPFGPPT
jgi:predicted RNA-binding protein associated with RNAse of E/G family